MKDQNQVFVSYGHVEEKMCKKICAYLEKEGFKPWVDTTKLQHGMLWRDEIRKGIEESGQVLALLSAYSTRDRGVCLDEITIAVGVTGGNIHTILLQEENVINVPPTIGFEQWFDMSDWKTKADDEAWFKSKMADVVKCLRDPAHAEHYGQITELRKKLNVQYAVGRQQKLLKEHYTGRRWLEEKIDNWLEDPNAPRRCLVTGAPGVGKSSFAVHYSHYNPKTAAALFFSADMPTYNDPCAVIQTLAYLLACRLSAYRKSLLWELDQEDRATLAKLTEKELFDKLITKPLNQSINGDHPPMCIILDGLEECGDPQKNTLAKTIAKYADSLPWWLHILIVARDVPAVKNYTKNALRIEMCGEDKNNLDDVREYYKEALEDKFGSDPAWPETLEKITERSQGIFLYAKMLTNLLLDKGTLDVGGDYPEGLSEVFTLWFDWFFPDGEDYARRWRLPIGCVLGSPEPIPAQTLRRVFAWSENELADFKARLSILLRKDKNVFGDETLVFDHDFVKEWLTSGGGENFYFSSPEDGRKKIANALYAVFEEDAEELTYWEAVQLLDLPLTKKQRRKAVENVELGKLILSAGNYCYIWNELDESEKIYKKRLKELEKQEKGKEKIREIVKCLICIGYIKQAQGKLANADSLYKRAYSIGEILVKDGGEPEDIRIISEICDCAGSLCKMYDEDDIAIKLNKKSTTLMENLVKNFENYEDCVRLANGYYKGGTYVEGKDYLNAISMYKKALETYEKALNYGEESSLDVGLAETYKRIARNTDNAEEAKELYEKAMKLFNRVPKKAQTPYVQREIAMTHFGIGDCYNHQGNLNKIVEHYEKGTAIIKKLADENNTIQAYLDLACSNNLMGSLLAAEGNVQGQFELALQTMKQIEKVAKELDTPASYRALSASYGELATILDAQNSFDEEEKMLKKALSIVEEHGREKNKKFIRHWILKLFEFYSTKKKGSENEMKELMVKLEKLNACE